MSVIWVAVVVIGIDYSILRAGLSGRHAAPRGLHVEGNGPINTLACVARFVFLSSAKVPPYCLGTRTGVAAVAAVFVNGLPLAFGLVPFVFDSPPFRRGRFNFARRISCLDS